MRIERKGVTRIVFIFNKVVIKIPNFLHQWDHFLKGLIGNIHESKTWKYNTGNYDSGLSSLICPVLWCSWGGWILIMKRAKPLTLLDWETVTITNHRKYFPGDDTLSNYGWLDGNIVKIDYADLDYWPSDKKEYQCTRRIK